MGLWIWNNSLLITLFLYLFCCLIFGGSGRDGLLWHGLLHAIAAFGLALTTLTWPQDRSLGSLIWPIWLLLGVPIIGAVQCVPLPPSIWRNLPGRSMIAEDLESLGMNAPYMPISLSPEDTIITSFYVLPPLFVLLTCWRIGLNRIIESFPVFLILIACGTAAMGFVQVLYWPESDLYVFERSNKGQTLGFFANVNHFSALLVCALPFSIQLLHREINALTMSDAGVGRVFLYCLFLIVVIVGISIAGSIAGYLLSCFVIIAVLFILGGNKSQNLTPSVGASVLSFAVLVTVVLGFVPFFENVSEFRFSNSELSRVDIWSMTINAIGENWPVGTGLGTYQRIVPMFEDPSSVTSVYIARAHNDYLQLIVESGLLGAGWMLFLFIVLARMGLALNREFEGKLSYQVKQLALITILAIIFHSVIDYPIRTPAISAILAVVVSILSMDEPKNLSQKNGKSKAPRGRVL